jgi:2'-5' RNA ligase
MFFLIIKNFNCRFWDSDACSKITLFESRLGPHGANYIILREFALK